MLTKDIKFQIKAVSDSGSFEGLAAVYGNVDLGGDIIAPGAFAKTIREKKGEVPILWQHDQREPIGLGTLTDSKEGLQIEGQLVLESPVAQKAYALMKARVLKGLSIGYDTVVSEYDNANDIRTLKELKLWEVSVVTFAMNPLAEVTSVKQMQAELEAAIETVAQHAQSIAEAHKSGRTISAATRDRLNAAHEAMKTATSHISALLVTSDDDADKAAAIRNARPEIHLAVTSLESVLAKALSESR